jgi:hypothetical protein
MIVQCAFAFLACCCVLFAETSTIRERRSGERVIDRLLLTSRDEFSEKHVRKIALEFVAAHRTYGLLRLGIATSAEDAQIAFMGSGGGDRVFEPMQKVYSSQNPPRGPVAEMLKMGDRASIRFRWPDGRISETVLQRGSAFSFRFRSETVSILGIALKIVGMIPIEGPIAESKDPEPLHSSIVYVATKRRLSLHEAATISREIRNAVRTPWVDVQVDQIGLWFEDGHYVIRNWFVPDRRIPTAREYHRRIRLYCFAYSHECTEFGLR